MKILLLLYSIQLVDDITIDNAQNYYEMLFVYIKNKFLEYPDIELETRNCIPCVIFKDTHNTSSINAFPHVDHIIFIHNTGFKKYERFITYLHKFASISVSSLCDNNMFNSGENIVFHFKRGSFEKDNDVLINVPYLDIYDDDDIDADLLVDQLNILIKTNDNVELNNVKLDDVTTNNVLNKYYINKIKNLAERNKDIIQINTYIINKNGIYMYDFDNNAIEKIADINYHTVMNLYKYINICIFDYYPTGIYELYELSMFNILIITELQYIGSILMNQLTIIPFTYKNNHKKFKWSDIFNALSLFDCKNKLLNDNFTLDNTVDIIYNTLQNYRNTDVSKNILLKNDHVKTLNIYDKNKINIHITKNTNENKPSVKKRILLQSNLLS